MKISEDVGLEARSAVADLAGKPEYLTLAGLVERALRAELDRLARSHNNGQPFRAADSEKLKGGRLRAGRPSER